MVGNVEIPNRPRRDRPAAGLDPVAPIDQQHRATAAGEFRGGGGPGRSAADHHHAAPRLVAELGVGHDARDEHAGLRRVEVADGQAHDVRLDVLAGEHADDARQGLGLRRVDALDQRVRMRAALDRGVQHVRQHDVVAVRADRGWKFIEEEVFQDQDKQTPNPEKKK